MTGSTSEPNVPANGPIERGPHMALLGLRETTDLSPQSGPKRTLIRSGATVRARHRGRPRQMMPLERHGDDDVRSSKYEDAVTLLLQGIVDQVCQTRGRKRRMTAGDVARICLVLACQTYRVCPGAHGRRIGKLLRKLGALVDPNFRV